MHHPKTKLGSYMVKQVRSAIADVDAAILVADVSYEPGDIEIGLLKKLHDGGMPTILVLNKTDLSTPEQVGATIQKYAELCEFASVVPVCAMKNDGVDIVLDEAEKLLTEGEWVFEEDDITDQPEKQIAAETVREKLLRLIDNEIPHGCAVVVEEFTEQRGVLRIRAEIFCERESHKRIIIGKKGEMLKKIGSYAREDLEKFFGVQVFLDLWVKVKENWRESEINIANFGFKADN